jgi:hypothetical protein
LPPLKDRRSRCLIPHLFSGYQPPLAEVATHPSNRFVLKVFGALLLLLAFCLPGLLSQESRVAAKVLADALGGLSDTDLKQEHDFVSR